MNESNFTHVVGVAGSRSCRCYFAWAFRLVLRSRVPEGPRDRNSPQVCRRLHYFAAAVAAVDDVVADDAAVVADYIDDVVAAAAVRNGFVVADDAAVDGVH